MCLLILNKEEILPESEFKNGWSNNPHGGGLAWVSEGKIKAWRTLKGWRAMYTKYVKERESNPESLFIVHFRFATHGAKNLENTHPFKITSKLYFAHNGVMSKYGDAGLGIKSKSDSRDFGEKVLSVLPPEFIYNNHVCSMLEEHIGKYNKIVLINSDNEYRILNESSGHWCHRKNNWYSNDGYKPRDYTYGDYENWKSKYKNTMPTTKTTTPVTYSPPACGLQLSSKHLTKVEFDHSEFWDSDGSYKKIKNPKWAASIIGRVPKEEIDFAEFDCGLTAFVNECNKMVWAFDGDRAVEYSRYEIKKWMDEVNKIDGNKKDIL